MIQKIKLISLLSLFILIEIFLIIGQAYSLAFAFFLFIFVILLVSYKFVKKFTKIKTILSKKENVEEMIPILDNRALVVFRNKEGVYFVQPINPKNFKTINDFIIKKVIDYEITQGNIITKLMKTLVTKDLKAASKTQYNWTFILEGGHKIIFPFPFSYKEHIALENFMLKYFKK